MALTDQDKRLLTFQKQRDSIRRLWNIEEKTVNFLSLLLKLKKPERLLELGTSNGYSAYCFFLATEESETRIETIECDRERFELAKENLMGLDRIVIHYGLVEDVLPTLTGGYDFVFIDANKKDYVLYLKMLKPKLNREAVVVADNVLSHQTSVESFLGTIRQDRDFISVNLEIDSGLEISLYQPQHKQGGNNP